MKYVLLLRASAEDGPDRYEAAFEASGYAPLSVPVLETVLVHGDVLGDKITCGPDAQGLSGVIMTSKRAVEAWRNAVQVMDETAIQADWRTIPFYVVGDATATAASQIRTALPSMARLAPSEGQIRGGAEAGTAERLAVFIIGEGDCEGRRLLYLTGDKNKETLPRMLTAHGVALETLEVYGTAGSSTFPDDLRAVLPEMDGEQGWVVYFAPSVAAFVTPVLRDALPLDALNVAAIGPTTASFLQDTLRMRVDVVAPRPTPDALCRAVAAFDDVG